jgi:hypothetical protein
MAAPNSYNNSLGLITRSSTPTVRTGINSTTAWNPTIRTSAPNSSNNSLGLNNKSMSTSTTTSSSGPSFDTAAYDSMYKSVLGDITAEIEKYTQKLTEMAQGDYDFAAKWIETNYKEALGTDDVQRAEFFKKVADSLETKVGRIVYDYDRGTYRNEQNRDIALTRLKEDEKVLMKDYETGAKQTRQNEQASLNQRGLISGTREGAEGYTGNIVKETEGVLADKLTALRRSISEGQADINLAANRTGEDLTTTARRAGLDEEQARGYQTETAQRALAKQKLQIEQEAAAQKRQAPTYASAEALRRLGIA